MTNDFLLLNSIRGTNGAVYMKDGSMIRICKGRDSSKDGRCQWNTDDDVAYVPKLTTSFLSVSFIRRNRLETLSDSKLP